MVFNHISRVKIEIVTGWRLDKWAELYGTKRKQGQSDDSLRAEVIKIHDETMKKIDREFKKRRFPGFIDEEEAEVSHD